MNIRHHTYRPFTVSSLFTAHNSQAENYAFASKERDTETGLSYFGARYYSSDLSIWLSVDPMSDKYPSTSPYAYCRNNSIILYDPNGMFDDWVEDKNGHVYWDENATSQETTKPGETYLGKEGQRCIGRDVWNYNSDGTIDELRPVTISMNKELTSNSEIGVFSDQDEVEKADKVISNVSLTAELPVAAAAESVAKNSSKIALKSFGSFFSIATVVPDVIRYAKNPTVGNRNKMIVSGLGSAISLLPVVGPIGSVIWNSIDMGGGFDKFYR